MYLGFFADGCGAALRPGDVRGGVAEEAIGGTDEADGEVEVVDAETVEEEEERECDAVADVADVGVAVLPVGAGGCISGT